MTNEQKTDVGKAGNRTEHTYFKYMVTMTIVLIIVIVIVPILYWQNIKNSFVDVGNWVGGITASIALLWISYTAWLQHNELAHQREAFSLDAQQFSYDRAQMLISLLKQERMVSDLEQKLNQCFLDNIGLDGKRHQADYKLEDSSNDRKVHKFNSQFIHLAPCDADLQFKNVSRDPIVKSLAGKIEKLTDLTIFYSDIKNIHPDFNVNKEKKDGGSQLEMMDGYVSFSCKAICRIDGDSDEQEVSIVFIGLPWDFYEYLYSRFNSFLNDAEYIKFARSYFPDDAVQTLLLTALIETYEFSNKFKVPDAKGPRLVRITGRQPYPSYVRDKKGDWVEGSI
jgi:hypothetical protein